MSSILTNVGAMVALQNLQSINKNLAKVQGQISTGKSVADAKDNAAVWAISKVMESDVSGFKAISSSLALGESTVSVARQAAETVTDLLTQMKDKVVASQGENVDRAKIQTDVEALRDQIAAVTGAAQFNGLNLLNNDDYDAGSGAVNVLSSLDRSGTGVQSSNIGVSKQDLSTTAAVYDAAGTGTSANAMVATTAADGTTDDVYTVLAGDATAGVMFEIAQVNGVAIPAGQEIVISANDGDTVASIQQKLITGLQFAADRAGLDVTYSADETTAGQINITNNSGAALAVVAADMTKLTGATDDGFTTIGGGLSLLNQFDVTTDDGAKAALGAIEGMIQTSIDSAAAFGSAQRRIETQSDFVDNLTGALKTGIGTLVDANMEEASARLQALQVQQQLGVQALSIANQAPQSLLSLFR